MFDPIDYVIFEGLSEKQKVDKILFCRHKIWKSASIGQAKENQNSGRRKAS